MTQVPGSIFAPSLKYAFLSQHYRAEPFWGVLSEIIDLCTLLPRGFLFHNMSGEHGPGGDAVFLKYLHHLRYGGGAHEF